MRAVRVIASRRQAFLKEEYPEVFRCLQDITFSFACCLPRNSSSSDGACHEAGIDVRPIGRDCDIEESVVSPVMRLSTAEGCCFHACRAASSGKAYTDCATWRNGKATISALVGALREGMPADTHMVFVLALVGTPFWIFILVPHVSESFSARRTLSESGPPPLHNQDVPQRPPGATLTWQPSVNSPRDTSQFRQSSDNAPTRYIAEDDVML